MATVFQSRCSSALPWSPRPNNNYCSRRPVVSWATSRFASFPLSKSTGTVKASFPTVAQVSHAQPADGACWDVGDSGRSDADSNFQNNIHTPAFSSLQLRQESKVFGVFVEGWKSRVAADPQFPFKLLMEELVGVFACVLGDMASRPNFGLNELDFVFSTLVVGSILNFTLMYLLAPTISSSSSIVPLSIFANCPKSHMFEPGAYTSLNRLGTLLYKGSIFSAVGFSAGLVGTAISNGLIKLRKEIDPDFKTPNKPPPTFLNALTWALHMGISSNLRYQALNGIEFLFAQWLPSSAFRISVILLRCLNNVLGGMSFVILARLTGSQGIEDNFSACKERLLKEGKEH